MELPTGVGRPAIKFAFPTFYSLSQDQPRAIWNEQPRLESDAFLAAFNDHVQDEQQLSFDQPLGRLVELAYGFLRDLLALKDASSSPEREACDFLQLGVAVDVVRNAVSQGQLGVAHDWIIHSCVDELPYPAEAELPPERFLSLVRSTRPYLAAASEPLFFEWLGLLFYYSRARGALRGHAEVYFLPALAIVEELLRNGRHAEGLAIAEHLLCWAAVNNRDEAGKVAAAVEQLHYRAEVDPRLRKRVGMVFTTFAARWTG